MTAAALVTLAAGAALALAALPAAAQEAGDTLAELWAGIGCVVDEAELSAAFVEAGHSNEEYEAEYVALDRRGHVEQAPEQGDVRLVNWGACT